MKNKHITKIKRNVCKHVQHVQTLPEGLELYDEDGPCSFIDLKKIVVDSERSKRQLLLTSEYIHNLKELDTNIVGANLIAHLYLSPELIEVER